MLKHILSSGWNNVWDRGNCLENSAALGQPSSVDYGPPSKTVHSVETCQSLSVAGLHLTGEQGRAS